MRSAGRSETGKVRANNEDNYQIFNVGSACIMVLADGIGGMSGGEIASRIAVETISDKINGEASFDSLSDDEIKALLENAYREANVAILKKALSDPELMGMGTTLTVAVIRERKVLIAHMGDCRAYLIHGSAMTQLTADHTYAAELLRRQSITKEEFETHPERHTLVKSLGENAFLIPDLYVYNIIYGDMLLLCTDGLCSFVSDEHIKACLKQRNDLEGCLDSLFESAYEAGSDDNITVLLTHVKPGPTE
ncbi:protein phosphatase [Ruminococcaceae bacterium KH2T8]|nr:protein phosphatase [Ruminococcaceae bacterium KH2T8]